MPSREAMRLPCPVTHNVTISRYPHAGSVNRAARTIAAMWRASSGRALNHNSPTPSLTG